MKIIGIIAEYNPFHNGHEYQIKKCKELYPDCRIIIVMSGNFTQRAQPAVFDKWLRSKAAVLSGADLVLELPFLYAVSGAESFARGAIRLLNSLNCINYLIFGTESDLNPLKKAASVLNEEPSEYRTLLKETLKTGVTFARAREIALQNLYDLSPDILNKPNNILAIEYLKALKKLRSQIIPHNILRIGGGHNERILDEKYSSSTALRYELKQNGANSLFYNNIPQACRSVFEFSDYLIDFDYFFRLILAKIRTLDNTGIKKISEVSEGAENRILKAAQTAKTYDELVDLIQTRRYPYSRVRRILLNCLFGITYKISSRAHSDMLYARVLAANKKSGILSVLSENSAIPIIIKANDLHIKSELLKFDLLASEIYGVLTATVMNARLDYTRLPYIF